jgi:hypothetical protein
MAIPIDDLICENNNSNGAEFYCLIDFFFTNVMDDIKSQLPVTRRRNRRSEKHSGIGRRGKQASDINDLIKSPPSPFILISNSDQLMSLMDLEPAALILPPGLEEQKQDLVKQQFAACPSSPSTKKKRQTLTADDLMIFEMDDEVDWKKSGNCKSKEKKGKRSFRGKSSSNSSFTNHNVVLTASPKSNFDNLDNRSIVMMTTQGNQQQKGIKSSSFETECGLTKKFSLPDKIASNSQLPSEKIETTPISKSLEFKSEIGYSIIKSPSMEVILGGHPTAALKDDVRPLLDKMRDMDFLNSQSSNGGGCSSPMAIPKINRNLSNAGEIPDFSIHIGWIDDNEANDPKIKSKMKGKKNSRKEENIEKELKPIKNRAERSKRM